MLKDLAMRFGNQGENMASIRKQSIRHATVGMLSLQAEIFRKTLTQDQSTQVVSPERLIQLGEWDGEPGVRMAHPVMAQDQGLFGSSRDTVPAFRINLQSQDKDGWRERRGTLERLRVEEYPVGLDAQVEIAVKQSCVSTSAAEGRKRQGNLGPFEPLPNEVIKRRNEIPHCGLARNNMAFPASVEIIEGLLQNL